MIVIFTTGKRLGLWEIPLKLYFNLLIFLLLNNICVLLLLMYCVRSQYITKSICCTHQRFLCSFRYRALNKVHEAIFVLRAHYLLTYSSFLYYIIPECYIILINILNGNWNAFGEK